MITLAEIRQYLKIGDDDTGKDAYLLTVIPKAVSYIESYLNRVLQAQDFTERKHNCYASVFYTDQYPINSISAIKEIDRNNVETDLIQSPNTIADSVYFSGNKIVSFKGYYVNGAYSITYNAGYKFQTLSGTVATTAGSPNVAGTGTAFTELAAGDMIIIGSERKQIAEITSDTAMVMTDAYVNDNDEAAIILTTLPEILKQALLEISAQIFKNSWQGDSTLLQSSKTVSDGATSLTTAMRKVDLSYIDNFKNYVV